MAADPETPVIVREQSPAARRLTAILFGGVALSSTAYIAMVTVASLTIDELTGSASLAGVPGATGVVGTALGTTLLSLGVARRGRRPGMVLGYAAGAIGAAIAAMAVLGRSVAALIAGMALVGLGNASSHLARYAAADMYPVSKRATALAWVVWGSTIGSVAGPSLLGPVGNWAESLGRSELVGGYVAGAVFMGLAAILCFSALRPDPARVALETPSERRIVLSEITTAFRSTAVRAGLVAMVTGQVVMVMIMTATPLHIRHQHHTADLGAVGIVMSAHTLGMFAFSPLVGRLVDRIGGHRVAVYGMTALALSALGAAYGPNESIPGLVAALWLLGIGWNMTFVAGSSTLSKGLDVSIRARVQGAADSITWMSSATTSVLAGVLYQATDYRALGILGLVLLAAPFVFILRRRLQPA